MERPDARLSSSIGPDVSGDVVEGVEVEPRLSMLPFLIGVGGSLTDCVVDTDADGERGGVSIVGLDLGKLFMPELWYVFENRAWEVGGVDGGVVGSTGGAPSGPVM